MKDLRYIAETRPCFVPGCSRRVPKEEAFCKQHTTAATVGERACHVGKYKGLAWNEICNTKRQYAMWVVENFSVRRKSDALIVGYLRHRIATSTAEPQQHTANSTTQTKNDTHKRS
jgi:hypothetical protein